MPGIVAKTGVSAAIAPATVPATMLANAQPAGVIGIARRMSRIVAGVSRLRARS
ncbi:hypothetical protein FHT37_002218 [Mitsuaria sp. BK037]|nr:hypothetical protein [Mitsuaria sp. BK037]